ncbi:MAG: helix-turn-helix domain-containing protein [Caulobacteraceae bacterium]
MVAAAIPLSPIQPPAREACTRGAPNPPGLVERLRREVGASVVSLTAGEEVFGEDARADCLYEVLEGVVRTLRIGRSGQRVVHGFFVAGELFGLESGAAGVRAEAVGGTRVVRVDGQLARAAARLDPLITTQLWAWLCDQRTRAETRVTVAARGVAAEKLAHFLLEMAARTGAGPRLRLPMPRSDIGDYLGLSSETVSRGFTSMRRRRFISITRDSVLLIEPARLRALAAVFD